MIISRGRKYIFVHIPKTGGTSLALALESKAMKDDILIGDTPKAVKRRKRLKGVATSGRLWKHARLRDVYGLVTQAEIEAYFVVTIVRNPWDRAVSYYHWLQDQSFENKAVALAQTLDFSAFLNHPHIVEAFRQSPYSSYVRDEAGVERCDLFLRLEDLAKGVEQLQTALDIRLPVLEHVNQSSRKRDWRGYYNDADAGLIARNCAMDIARFDYRFE